MATTKPKSPVAQKSKRVGRRRWPWLIPLALLALLVWYWTPLIGMAQTGASFGARVACSCRYVAGRSLGDCRKDFESGMGLVILSEDTTAKTVTARFPLLASQTATYRDGPGCVLESWDD
jgi:hypothetical protein